MEILLLIFSIKDQQEIDAQVQLNVMDLEHVHLVDGVKELQDLFLKQHHIILIKVHLEIDVLMIINVMD